LSIGWAVAGVLASTVPATAKPVMRKAERPFIASALRVHLVRAARRHAAHLRDIVVKGESPLASAIMAAAAFAFIAPLVALVIVLALAAAHYAT
jgi:hypothetical protein